MKKLLVASLFSTLAFSAPAHAEFYAQGDLGFSQLSYQFKEPTGAVEKVRTDDWVFAPRISLGYDLGRLRFALDYTNFGKAKTSKQQDGYDISTSLKLSSSVGVSAIFDFQNDSAVTPYVGVRVAHNRSKADMVAVNRSNRSEVKRMTNSNSDLGIGALIGIQYRFNKNLDLNVGGEYNRIHDDFSQVGGNVGLRVNF